MEERFDIMWNEYINGRLSVKDWLEFAKKYRSWWNKDNKDEKSAE